MAFQHLAHYFISQRNQQLRNAEQKKSPQEVDLMRTPNQRISHEVSLREHHYQILSFYNMEILAAKKISYINPNLLKAR